MQENVSSSLTGKLLIRVIGVVLVSYILSYFLLMDRNLPARKNGVLKFQSSFRLAPSGEPIGPLGILTVKATAFNYIYYPMDLLYFWLCESNGQSRPSRI